MLVTVEGFYRNGRVDLIERPRDIQEGARVLVTFVGKGIVDLQERGIDEGQAAELRGRLATFAEDWDSPEMSEYDDYESNHRKLEPR